MVKHPGGKKKMGQLPPHHIEAEGWCGAPHLNAKGHLEHLRLKRQEDLRRRILELVKVFCQKSCIFSGPKLFVGKIADCKYRYMGVSQNEAAGTGSLSQGSVSRVCFVVCFGGLFRTVLLPRTVKFKGSVSGSVSKVCFGGLFRQSRTSQPYLKLHSPKKCKPIYIDIRYM